MATIKVKLRNSTVAGKAGTVYYQLFHGGKSRQITTSIHLQPHEWNLETGQVHPFTINAIPIQESINKDLLHLKRIVRYLDRWREAYTVNDIVRYYKKTSNGISVLAFIRMEIELLKRCERLGTAKNYERMANSFSQFLAEADIPFSTLTEEFVEDYNAFLIKRGILRNSVSFYMRNLRAIYNKAVRQHLVEQTYPFRNVYTGVDRTRKRAVDRQLVARLYKLDLSGNRPLAFARDLFVFSYCTRGMAFVDIAYLRKVDIKDGMIHYLRHKTGHPLAIRLEPCIRMIIDRYAAMTGDSPYVFPILTTTEAVAAYEQYLTALNNHNRLLYKLSGLLQTECKLTSYTPRHSWATAARNCNIPLSVISAGLGHTSERTTQIYLAMLENSIIDSANQNIIKMLEQ